MTNILLELPLALMITHSLWVGGEPTVTRGAHADSTQRDRTVDGHPMD